MLKTFSPRPYQLDIFQSAIRQNTLVVLPTGLGKTAIAMMVAARRLLMYPKLKIVFVAPTKPLVEQQLKSFKKSFLLHQDEYALFTGSVSPTKRQELWTHSKIVFSTPQTIENDVLSNKISLEEVSLFVFDEAHRATGDYAYCFLAKNYLTNSRHPRVLALTASPGSDQQKIDEVTQNLGVEKIEYRKPNDKEIEEFTAGTSVTWKPVLLPELFSRIINYLKEAYNNKLAQVKDLGFLFGSYSNFTKSQLLKLQQQLHGRVVKGEKSIEILQSISILAQALKLSHAIELAESQTIFSLHEYLFGILKQSKTTRTKAIKNLAIDPLFLSALSLTRDALKTGLEHPKVEYLRQHVQQIISKKSDAKIIIFSQYRDTASLLQKELDKLSVTSELFFGQAKKNGVGLSQKQQQEVLDKFRNNDFSCLIATSVAEEGLDIPSVDHVIFYEPVPSAIRSVQRRGRTGRHSEGFVTVLIAKGTRDEAFRWIAHHKENRMYDVLNNLSKKPQQQKEQRSLSEFKKQESQAKIITDFREKGSPVLKALHNLPVDLELKQLQVGDFVLSKECCVEYKNYPDFVDSIVDGRLLSQLRSLSQYSKPVVIIEGQAEVHRKIDPNAITGMLSTIALSYRIPVLRTFSPLETAQLLLALAKSEQEEQKDSFTYHTAKPLDQKELLEYVVGSFPSVGGSLAKSLLEHFDTIADISKASIDDLRKIPLIGEKKAQAIYDLFSLSYKKAKDDPYEKEHA